MKRILSLVLAVLMLLSLSAFASAEGDGVRDSIVLAEQSSEWWGADVTQLDGTAYFQRLMGEPICTMDADGMLQPNIASEVSISDDRSRSHVPFSVLPATRAPQGRSGPRGWNAQDAWTLIYGDGLCVFSTTHQYCSQVSPGSPCPSLARDAQGHT